MEEKPQIKPPKLRKGMTVEVLTLENRLTFVGKVEEYTGGTLTIRESNGQELPPVLYNKEIKLRCFQGEKVLVLYGKICGSSRWIWKLDRLENKFANEKRAFFRQLVAVKQDAACTRAPAGKEETAGQSAATCHVKDISAGGVMIIDCREEYHIGDRLTIENVYVVKEEPPFSFTCRVRRASEKRAGKYSYGCQFESVAPKEEDRLLRAIFKAQRQELQAQRDRGL